MTVSARVLLMEVYDFVRRKALFFINGANTSNVVLVGGLSSSIVLAELGEFDLGKITGLLESI